MRAGYSQDPVVASAIASENLRKPLISEALYERLQERNGISRARVADELARIGFSDIRKVVTWRPEAEAVKTDNDGEPSVTTIKSRVTVLDSSQIDEATAAAVASVSQGQGGTLKIQMHDKVAALDKLARVLRMYNDKVELTGKDGAPLFPTAPTVIFDEEPGTVVPRPAAQKAARRVPKPGH